MTVYVIPLSTQMEIRELWERAYPRTQFGAWLYSEDNLVKIVPDTVVITPAPVTGIRGMVEIEPLFKARMRLRMPERIIGDIHSHPLERREKKVLNAFSYGDWVHTAVIASYDMPRLLPKHVRPLFMIAYKDEAVYLLFDELGKIAEERDKIFRELKLYSLYMFGDARKYLEELIARGLLKEGYFKLGVSDVEIE